MAPVSWLVQRDVEQGCKKLNFSTWDQGKQEVFAPTSSQPLQTSCAARPASSPAGWGKA
ncbi:MAG: heme-binding domain-containing protein, partial [Anaerolineales bacterium]|nr:heme-binding domain-containing protein [Anaerolineales bacterium]